jgi:hypothetical protein
MRRSSQGKLRGLCLAGLFFGAIACSRESAEPAAQAAAPPVPLWAQNICENWKRRDGSCDQMTLIADYEECMRTDGLDQMERLRRAGVRQRMRLLAQERATMLCLEKRSWVITETGQSRRIAHPMKPKYAPPN